MPAENEPRAMNAVPAATVAIIMRTKNRSLLLDRGIRDVLNQTYTDWTLLIINDGGPSRPVDSIVAKHAGEAQARIQVLHNSSSMGMEAASNLGIRATESTYIAIHDDDDQWRPDFLQSTVDCLIASGGQGVMVRTDIVYERIIGDRIEVVGRERFAADITEITLFDLLRHNRGVPISFLYRRSVHDQIGFYDESLPAVGDWEFHLRFASRFSIGFIDGEARAYWNQRREATGDMGNSFTARSDDHRKYDLLVREQYLKAYVETHGVGALLYLTKLQDRQSHEFQLRADHIERKLQELLDAVSGQSARLDRFETGRVGAGQRGVVRRQFNRFRERITKRGQNAPRTETGNHAHADPRR
ncbi:glycosyltransferase family 2 protein [Arthrobacter terrae]|nr:glycosyltransferase family 2 protein [Arthrobacter terrae]